MDVDKISTVMLTVILGSTNSPIILMVVYRPPDTTIDDIN